MGRPAVALLVCVRKIHSESEKEKVKKWIETLKKVGKSANENVDFLLKALAVVAVIMIVAGVAEYWIRKSREKKGETVGANTKSSLKLHRMTLIAMLSAVATVLMLLEFPIPGIPVFYKMDFSELPVIIGAFAMGPVAGVIIEFLKVLLNLVLNGTSTAFVGEFANFIMGCCFIVPASILYYARKTKRMSRIGLAVGCLSVTICSCFLNAYLLLPTYSKLFHMDLDKIIGMGTDRNGMIKTLRTFILYGVAPFNLVKYGVVSLITLVIYKHISRLLKRQA